MQEIGKVLVIDIEKRFHELEIDIVASLIENWNKDSMEVFEKLGYYKHLILHISRKKTDV